MDAVVVGSQVTISATFSIISQCCALNRFARVKIVHTSQKKKTYTSLHARGQLDVYVPLFSCDDLIKED